VCAEIVAEAVTVTVQEPVASVQTPAALKVSPPLDVIVIVPVGVVAPAPPVSATVIVTVPLWPAASVDGVAVTVVEVERPLTVNVAVSLLVA
jgi:hypothetical protein